MSSGQPVYLLSNNVALDDREALQKLYYGIQRNKYIAWFGGLWLGTETIMRCTYFRKMAVGWRCLSLFSLAFLYKTMFTFYTS